MKPIRKEYPPIRVYKKSGQTYFRVDLRRKHHVGPKTRQFTDKQQAIDFAKGIALDVAQNGLNSIAKHGTDARIGVWSDQLAKYGKTVEDAMQLALKHYAGEEIKLQTPYIAELLTVWVDDKLTNPLKPLRTRTIKSIRAMGANFKKDFGMMRMGEVTSSFVEDYIKTKKVSNQTRKNIVAYLSQFFNWAIKKNHISIKNPAAGLEIHVEQGTPEFFTVEQCKTIMRASLTDSRISSYFAICLFGGIRPQEAERMTWENILLETKEITLEGKKSKTKKARLFEIEPLLLEWLNHADKSQPLIPKNFRKLSDKAMANLGFDWINDGLRHTFATFHYAKFNKLEMLRHIMGNSPGVIEKFYKGVISSSEVEKFWAITPESLKVEVKE